MTSGPTQNYTDPDLGRWRPHPVLAGAVRAGLLALPVVLVVAFGLGAAHWFPADRLGVNRWAWVGVEVVVSLLLLLGATRVAKKLLPLSSLLKLTLYFPDRAPSRMAVALRHLSPDALRHTLAAPSAHGRKLTEERDHAARLLDLIAAIGAHDALTAGHSERVQAYAALVGKELGLSAQDAAKLSWAALLHDVGKLAVPAAILSKSTQPTSEEWAILATHPHAGREIAAPLEDWLGSWLDAIDQHHERWDGGGYPRGLSGTQISLGARIVAVVDAYDVITSARSYKAPLSAVAARQELARCAGTQFDPEVVRAMLAVSLGKLRMIAGPLSALSALPGLGSTPLPGLASVGGTVGSAAGAVTAAVVGAALGLVGPAVLPSDASPRTVAEGAVATAPSGTPTPLLGASDLDLPWTAEPTPSASPSAPGTDEGLGSEPGEEPSTDPTTVPPLPGGTPSVVPTPGLPSAIPTAVPSALPTAIPTALPTALPTAKPTAVPTAPAAPAVPSAPAAPSAPAPSPTPTGTNACEWAQNGWQPLPSKNLKDCDLRGRTLTGSFVDVDLKGADLTGAVLTSIDLTRADLKDAILTGATISSATLRERQPHRHRPHRRLDLEHLLRRRQARARPLRRGDGARQLVRARRPQEGHVPADPVHPGLVRHGEDRQHVPGRRRAGRLHPPVSAGGHRALPPHG